MAILIVGGAGYIGSYVNLMMNKKGFETIVLDNLSTGNKDAVNVGTLIVGDLGDTATLKKVFEDNDIDAVMHFAAHTAVGESVKDPGKYYHNNVVNTLALLDTMVDYGVKRFLFSSSAAIFGSPEKDLIDEEHRVLPINPYGRTKLMIEKILGDYDIAYGMKSCCLRYFNAAGGDPSGEHKNYNINSTNIIPVILNAIEKESPVTIFGTDYDTIDGTCVRDYIHIHDLASAHISALEKLLVDDATSSQYNLGNGDGYSVSDVIDTAKKVTGVNFTVIEGERRAGDPDVLVASAKKAQKELGWKPEFPDLESIILHQWKATL
ncbi:MAG: UDP-glucose 4-epimerase GalE [Waddliaceae bacterium]|jgi:UDP-glucose 4-epimerase|nr:UDP-glucose 4-epimerase GalE [Waddliaceae bacterium]MBT3579166.1 UDP-glucose 4-epimerase GalE [Waddliaceae bacterium]MBT4444322.1 UDP-glucose 4-epimerase GalE [Waddliaceae bacterium]MBT6928537.1 UDP-glucose 4-epimerase GalE [Waddliaceae bacterium]MBT7264875.1 UDP-glucose 4-epimerase GalE [Waddliaceae bacterium]